MTYKLEYTLGDTTYTLDADSREHALYSLQVTLTREFTSNGVLDEQGYNEAFNAALALETDKDAKVRDFVEKAQAELDHLDGIIPEIPNMTQAQIKTEFERACKRDRQIIKALSYIAKRELDL